MAHRMLPSMLSPEASCSGLSWPVECCLTCYPMKYRVQACPCPAGCFLVCYAVMYNVHAGPWPVGCCLVRYPVMYPLQACPWSAGCCPVSCPIRCAAGGPVAASGAAEAGGRELSQGLPACHSSELAGPAVS